VQILSTGDDELAQKLVEYKSNMKEEVLEKDRKLNS
jgi:5-(carboxyamino)imidazole ribonucleotide mutase